MTINKEKTNNVNITEITKAGKAHTLLLPLQS